MSKDPRDEPNVETDVNGDMFYVTEDGRKIAVNSDREAESLKELEEHMKYRERFPMGMK